MLQLQFFRASINSKSAQEFQHRSEVVSSRRPQERGGGCQRAQHHIWAAHLLWQLPAPAPGWIQLLGPAWSCTETSSSISKALPWCPEEPVPCVSYGPALTGWVIPVPREEGEEESAGLLPECMPKHNMKGSILGSILQHSPALETPAMDTTGCQQCQEVALGHTHICAVSLWMLARLLHPLGWGTWSRQR